MIKIATNNIDTAQIVIKTRENGRYVNINEEVKVVHNMAILTEIPNKFYGVKIPNMYEINKDFYEINKLKENEYYVNYNAGYVFVNPKKDAKTIQVDYQGAGVIYYPASRIITKDKGDYIETLENVVNKSYEALNVVENINEIVNEANNLYVKLNTSIKNSSEINATMLNLIEKGNLKIRDIENIINNANIKKIELEDTIKSTQESIDNINNAKTQAIISVNSTRDNLIDSITKQADIEKTELNSIIDIAENKHEILKGTIDIANNNNNSLKENIIIAEKENDDLKISITDANKINLLLGENVEDGENKIIEIDKRILRAEEKIDDICKQEEIINKTEDKRGSNEEFRDKNERKRISSEKGRETLFKEMQEINTHFNSICEEFSTEIEYKVGNHVTYGGSTYQCIKDSFNILPDNKEHWRCIASKGLDGKGSGDMNTSVYDKDQDGVIDNSQRVNGFTVDCNVPSDAKFTDTVYNDKKIREQVEDLKKSKVDQIENDKALKNKADLINGKVPLEQLDLSEYSPDDVMSISIYDTNKNGIVDNSEKVNGFTVECNVPKDANFTDTIYDDKEIKEKISNIEKNKADLINGKVPLEQLALENYNPNLENVMFISEYDKDKDGIVDNAKKVNGFTVGIDVPKDAKFTDTVYDDRKIKDTISSVEENKVDRIENDKILKNKADLVDGKIPLEQLDLSNYGSGNMHTDKYDKNGDGIVDNAEKVNGFTVECNVPADANFTKYDDKELRQTIEQINIALGKSTRHHIVKTIKERDNLKDLRQADICHVTDTKETFIYDTLDIDENSIVTEWIKLSDFNSITSVDWSIIKNRPTKLSDFINDTKFIDEEKLKGKADLINGKVPIEQLPEDLGGKFARPERVVVLKENTDVISIEIPEFIYGDTIDVILNGSKLSKGTQFEVSEDGLSIRNISNGELLWEKDDEIRIEVYKNIVGEVVKIDGGLIKENSIKEENLNENLINKINNSIKSINEIEEVVKKLDPSNPSLDPNNPTPVALSLLDEDTGEELSARSINENLGFLKAQINNGVNKDSFLENIKSIKNNIESLKGNITDKVDLNDIEELDSKINELNELVNENSNNFKFKISTLEESIKRKADLNHSHNYDDLINKPTIVNSVFDAKCTYDGKNYILTLNGISKLPQYFTVRFKTPNNYVDGGNFIIGDVTYMPKNASFEINSVITAEFENLGKEGYCFFRSRGGSSETSVINDTLPPQIENLKFTSAGDAIRLSWDISDKEDLDGYVFTYKEKSLPKNIDDGKRVFSGKEDNGCTISGLSQNIIYYIRCFPFNKKKQYQTAKKFINFSSLGTLYTGDLEIGMKIRDNNTKFYGEPITWVVVDKNHSGYLSNSVTLMSDKILTYHCFDAKEPKNPNKEQSNYGNNKYDISNIRQWLNSNANAGLISSHWYSPQHQYDQEPDLKHVKLAQNRYYSEEGFMNGFSDSFKDIILPTKVETFYNGVEISTVDKIFLPSLTEINKLPKEYPHPNEGNPLEIFKRSTERWYPELTQGAISHNDSDLIERNIFILRSKVPESDSKIWTSGDGVGLTGDSQVVAYSGFNGVCPLINIKNDILIKSIDNETGAYVI